MDRSIVGLCLSLMILAAGCAGKNVSSSSGDAASRAGQAKSEEIKADAIKPIPLERSFERPANLGCRARVRSAEAGSAASFEISRPRRSRRAPMDTAGRH